MSHKLGDFDLHISSKASKVIVIVKSGIIHLATEELTIEAARSLALELNHEADKAAGWPSS